jgi:pimeloyl-ACP methyl ester carboxylesterase
VISTFDPANRPRQPAMPIVGRMAALARRARRRMPEGSVERVISLVPVLAADRRVALVSRPRPESPGLKFTPGRGSGMPTVERDGVELYYEAAGSGETVAFVPDVGTGAWLWGWQHAALAGPYEAVVWNPRGTGKSSRPGGDLSMRTFVNDLDAVLKDTGASATHVVGCGLGAMVALEYARQKGRARKLVLVSGAASGAAYDPAALFANPEDEVACRETLSSAFSDEFREAHPDVLDDVAAWRAMEDADREAWDRQRAALDDWDAGALYEIDNQALVVDGGSDELLAADASRDLAEGLARANRESFPDAGHFVHAERSRHVNDAILGFLEDAD